jgi:predicted MFS family arabinose efflux permease
VFTVAALGGLLRPSEMLVRQSLIADTVPRALLINALGFGRTTMEGARIVGPLIGAALFSALGIGPAYLCIALIYLASIVLSVRITVPARARDRIRARPWAELLDGIAYMRRAPAIVMCMLLAFLANLTAFPVTMGLLPVIARDMFASDENGLARMTAAVAAGALAGSILVAVAMRNAPPERVMLVGLAIWHALIAVLAVTDSPALAYPLLVLIGLSASGSMIPIAVVLMSQADADYRGRVMGVRMLAVYGLPLGLLAGGALFEWVGIAPTLLAYGGGGMLIVLLIAARWRRQAL